MERLVSQIQVFLEMSSSHRFGMVCIRVLIGALNGRLKPTTSSQYVLPCPLDHGAFLNGESNESTVLSCRQTGNSSLTFNDKPQRGHNSGVKESMG